MPQIITELTTLVPSPENYILYHHYVNYKDLFSLKSKNNTTSHFQFKPLDEISINNVVFQTAQTLINAFNAEFNTAEYVPENESNKQNNLSTDSTNKKYPTVTAVNVGLDNKVDKEANKSLVSNTEITKLTNLDNTKDVDKPVSIAQNIINNAKLDKGDYSGTAEDLDTKIDSLLANSRVVNNVTTTSPTPLPLSDNVHAIGVGPGTYANWGGMVVPANNIGTLQRVNQVYSVSLMPFILPSSKIENWIAKPYSSNEQVSHQGKDWFANANTIATEIPGTSNKWTSRLPFYDNFDAFKDEKNITVTTFLPVIWNPETVPGNNSTGTFTWTHQIRVINNQDLFNIAVDSLVVPQNSLIVASLSSSSFVPLTENGNGTTTAFLIVVNALFNVKQKGCVVIGRNFSTKWTSNFAQMIPKYWEVPYTDVQAQLVVNNTLNESRLISRNGILDSSLPTYFNVGIGILPIVDLPTNTFFSNLGITKAFARSTGTLTAPEAYPAVTIANGLVIPNANNWISWSYYVYSPDVDIKATIGRQRLMFRGGTNFETASATMQRIDVGIYLVTGKVQITGDLTSKNAIWFENQFKKFDDTAFANQTIYLTGFTFAYSTNANFILKDSILYDNQKKIENQIATITNPKPLNQHNNIAFNIARVSEFLRKYEMKEVDSFNQLNIVMAGDSVLARQTLSEMALTQDTNGGVGDGYITGHFPPNMWNQTVPFKLLQALQYKDADVKYYNHVASEVVKTGTWVNELVGADQARLAYTSQLNAEAVLTFTGASFVKCVFSSYRFPTTATLYPFQIAVSVNNGGVYVTPESLGLTTSLTKDNGVDGDFRTGNQPHKWFNIILGNLNPAVNYKIKFINKTATNLAFWGFETWTKPRINVIVVAEGGNVAGIQNTRWERFYSKYYNPDLIIYELPFLNDLGTGPIANFKGNAILTSVPNASPVLNDFWHASVDGVYANFNNTFALTGQYLQWTGTQWQVGQDSLNNALNTYKTNNNLVFQRLATLGVPVLNLITHNATSFYTRPFTQKNGLTILRNLVAKYGFGSIDVNYFQNDNGLQSSILSDTVHLNNTGVTMYVDLLKSILSIDYADRFVGTATEFQNKKLIGSFTGAGTIAFGYEFSKIPTVRIFNNNSITVTDKTQSGFTVTGSGSFEYEVFVD